MTAQLPGILSRRSLVKGVIAALSGLGSGPFVTGQEAKVPGRATEAEEIAKVEKLLRAARLGPLHNTRSAHFLAVGDAPSRISARLWLFARLSERRFWSISAAAGSPWNIPTVASP